MGSTYAQRQPLRIIGMSEIKQILLYSRFYGCTRKTLNMTKHDTIKKPNKKKVSSNSEMTQAIKPQNLYLNLKNQ